MEKLTSLYVKQKLVKDIPQKLMNQLKSTGIALVE